MKIVIAFILTAALVNCNYNSKSILIGKWEKNSNSSSTEAFEITQEGNSNFLATYTYFKKPTKYVKSNGDTVTMSAGSTINHKTAELYYDSQIKAYRWGREGVVYINIIDNDHLEVKFPAKTLIYNRVK
ncbi:MAG: hypothetical protein IPJ81_06155 [Chitinophagaceae bacterium]|jgi:hypothetical protein|nr:hypothetical protein [Chitinophagaceae bacterium]